MSGTEAAPEVASSKEEALRWRVTSTVKKWFDPVSWEAGLEPDEVFEDEGNVLTTAGLTRLLNLLIGAGGQAFTNGYARLGVGNGTTGATAADTNLAGASRLFHGMDATYPKLTAGPVLNFQATYQDGEANWDWREWAVDLGGAGTGVSNGTVVAPILNRRVPATSMGTKFGGVWTLATTVTIT